MRAAVTPILERFEAAWFWLRATVGGATVDASQVNSQLWCGGAVTTNADVAQLAAWGITADIDCREEFDDQSLIAGYSNLPPTPDAIKGSSDRAGRRIAYLYDPTADDGQPKPVAWFVKAWEFAQPILESGGVVYAHCAAGVNRGPSMAYFLLRAHWKLPADQALALIKTRRPVANVGYAADADKAIESL